MTAPHATGRVRAWLERSDIQLALLLAAGLLARLAFLASHDVGDFYAGGDGGWYVEQGWRIARGELAHPLTPVGPVYPLLLAIVWLFFPGAPLPAAGDLPPSGFLIAVRLAQVILSLIMVWLGYRLTRDLTGKHAPAMLAAAGLALSPAFVLEPVYILTEPVFMTLLTLAAYLYLSALRAPSPKMCSPAGVALGLSALTRPVVLLLPILLIPHLTVVFGWAKGRARLAFLLGGFLVTVLPWSAYLFVATGSPLPEGFASNLWIGAVGEGRWEGYRATDARRQGVGEDGRSYTGEALRIIGSDPFGWLALRARNVVDAVVTPHGTSDLAGPSIKALWAAWLDSDRALAGLCDLVRTRNFTWKLATYAFHYAAVALGMVGLGTAVRRWREFYFVLAAIVYLVSVHALLTILPRYLFPAEPFLWVLAAAGATRLTTSPNLSRDRSVDRGPGEG